MIESTQNDKIKYITRIITDNRFRKRENVFVVEGVQENERALQFGYEPIEYFLCESIFKNEKPKGKIHLVSEKVYEKIAYRGGTEGIIGIYPSKSHAIENYIPKENASIIIIESVEKPGNLGAILRSCEAFGIDALIVTDPKVDFYNPNVLRSSVGCFFGMQVFSSSNEEVFRFLEHHQVQICTTMMSSSAVDVSDIDFTKKSALVFGTESTGLSDAWKNVGRNCLIPMSGTIDSLNLSNAVAISCYEMQQQKKK